MTDGNGGGERDLLQPIGSLGRFLSGFESPLVAAQPRFLELMLDTTNKCNLRCVMCHFALEEVHSQSLQKWPADFLAKLEEEVLPLTRHAQLSLGSEPLVWKHFPDLLDACRRARVPVIDMYTNGLLMTEELADKIVATPMSRVQISLEGVGAEGFDRVRVGGSFDRFVAGVEMLVRAKERAGSELPRLQFNITMLRRNADQVESILHLAKRLGVQDLDFRHVVVHDGLGMEEQSFWKDRQGYNRLMKHLRAVAAELGLRIVVQPEDFEVGGPAVECAAESGPAEDPADGTGEKSGTEVLPPLWRRLASRFTNRRQRTVSDAIPVTQHSMEFVSQHFPERASAGDVLRGSVCVRNSGQAAWPARAAGQTSEPTRGDVVVTVWIDREWVATVPLSRSIAPGEECDVPIASPAPGRSWPLRNRLRSPGVGGRALSLAGRKRARAGSRTAPRDGATSALLHPSLGAVLHTPGPHRRAVHLLVHRRPDGGSTPDELCGDLGWARLPPAAARALDRSAGTELPSVSAPRHRTGRRSRGALFGTPNKSPGDATCRLDSGSGTRS